jgi:hypothetical protein
MEWKDILDSLPNENEIVFVKFKFIRSIGKAKFIKGDFYEVIDGLEGMSGGKLKKSNIISWSNG